MHYTTTLSFILLITHLLSILLHISFLLVFPDGPLKMLTFLFETVEAAKSLFSPSASQSASVIPALILSLFPVS